jgi:glycosyltransferase involved in cell wall biosynthesis
MLSYVPVSYDPRIRRAATTVAAKVGCAVLVIKPSDAAEALRDDEIHWHENIEFLSVGHAGTASYFPYCYDRDMVRAAVSSGAGIIHCHDANTCLMGLLAAASTGAAMVADFHEWSSENVVWSKRLNGYKRYPAYKRWIFCTIEKLVLRRASVVITLSASIAENLCSEAGVDREIVVVRNMPGMEQDVEDGTDLRQQLKLPGNVFLLLYQGHFGVGRNLEPVVKAIALTENVVLVMRGPGYDMQGERLRRLASEIGIADRVYLLPPVPSDRVVAEGASADAGVWNLEGLSKNFMYALGNKIFEYIASGLPVLVGSYREARRIIEDHQIGLVFDPNDPRSIADAITRLATDHGLLEQFRANVLATREEFKANPDWNKLLAIYEGFA